MPSGPTALAAADLETTVRETLGDSAAEHVQRTVIEGGEGQAARRLVDAAQGADLLVVGHRHGRNDTMRPGSVAEHLIARARCPVVVIPDTLAPAAEAEPRA